MWSASFSWVDVIAEADGDLFKICSACFAAFGQRSFSAGDGVKPGNGTFHSTRIRHLPVLSQRPHRWVLSTREVLEGGLLFSGSLVGPAWCECMMAALCSELSVWYHTLNCLGFPKEPQYDCVFWTKRQRVIVAVLWMLMLISLLYTDHSELKSKVQLRARDNVRVLICIESLCHRYTWVTAILNHKYA